MFLDKFRKLLEGFVILVIFGILYAWFKCTLYIIMKDFDIFKID